MKGLKLEPGCRQACVAWLNLLRLKSKPPTRARIAPVLGSVESKAASTSGICVMRQLFFSSGWTRITAPRRSRLLGGALSSSIRAASFMPSPLIVSTSPPRQ